MLEDRFAQHDKEFADKYHNPNADYAMTVRDYVLRPSADDDSGPITVYLPPVAEAKGRRYYIIVRNADAVNTVTIQDLDDSECWLGDIVWNGKCDGAIFESDGLAWWPLELRQEWPGMATTPPPGTKAPTTLAPTTAAAPQ